MTIHSQKQRAEQAAIAEAKEATPLAERLVRWNIDEITSELYVVTRGLHYVRAPHGLVPYCRSHDPMTDDCREAVRAVIAERLRLALDVEDEGCPKGDPDCTGPVGGCHDACEDEAERATGGVFSDARMARVMRCEDCGRKLTPCPARWDGEPTTVGYYACSCEEARSFDDEWNEMFADTNNSLSKE